MGRTESAESGDPTSTTGSIPTDPSEFTVYVANIFRKLLPDASFTVLGPLTIEVEPPFASPLQSNLDRIYDFFRRNPADCRSTVADFVVKAAAYLQDSEIPPARPLLRAVVRNSAYMDSLRQTIGSAADKQPIAQRFLGDLWLVCYFDAPTTMRLANRADTKLLGLSPKEAIALATKNIAAALPPLSATARRLSAGEIGMIHGDPYESSLILLHDAWRPLAQEFGGHLIVAVPAPDVVLYGSGADPDAIRRMTEAAQQAFSKSERPLATTVFRWTPSGWDGVSP